MSSNQRRKDGILSIQRRILSQEQINITDEAYYIINRAKNYDDRLIKLCSLIFFSTMTGDAWILDPKDGFALCLAQAGKEQLFNITETTTNFWIEWNADYQIEGDVFIVAKRSGQIKHFLGYPIGEILQITRQVR